MHLYTAMTLNYFIFWLGIQGILNALSYSPGITTVGTMLPVWKKVAYGLPCNVQNYLLYNQHITFHTGFIHLYLKATFICIYVQQQFSKSLCMW